MKKDRKTMLDEWRRNRAAGATTTAAPSPAKRAASPARAHSAPHRSLEPAALPAARLKSDEKENDGLSALERYRMRKQQQASGIDAGLAASTPSWSRSPFGDDDDSTETPRRKARRSLSVGGARKMRRMSLDHRGEAPVAAKSKPMLPPSYPSSAEEKEDAPPLSSNHVELTAFSQENVDSIDSLAMKSRISAMQKRIDSLEREKMELSMSKAPLEARMRQKEDTFIKERERLVSEIETLQNQGREVDERNRELEMENEAMGEIIKKMKLEAREAKSSGNGTGDQDSWNERLRNNKEIVMLRADSKDKDGQIKSLRMDKVSLEAEVHGHKMTIESLEKNYNELERDYAELDASKSKNSEAEIQLEVLTAEMVATTAQLNATTADFEETKSRAKADLKAKEDQWKARESELLFENSVLKSRAGKQIEANDDTLSEEDTAVLQAKIEARDRRISELEEQLLNGEQLRRQLHNRIQELRGNIRVYVRTRPFLPNDGASSSSSIDILPDGESLTIQARRGENAHAFKFDKVFAPSAGQDIVFDEVSEFVQSALDGYHVCLFSYGQTGSGKVSFAHGLLRSIWIFVNTSFSLVTLFSLDSYHARKWKWSNAWNHSSRRRTDFVASRSNANTTLDIHNESELS